MPVLLFKNLVTILIKHYVEKKLPKDAMEHGTLSRTLVLAGDGQY
jgi:hypothetical protein